MLLGLKFSFAEKCKRKIYSRNGRLDCNLGLLL
jgi:hypothetical protein